MNLNHELNRQLELLGIELDPGTIDRLLALQTELLRWNRTYNLTAITDPVEALEKHLVDSLTLLPHLNDATSLLDIGSGAGFPGLPLHLARPDIRAVSVDAVAKKILFQKHVVRKLGLSRFTPWHGRAESLPEHGFSTDGFDLVVARAFSSLETLVRLARPCLRATGRIVAMKGPEGESELQEAAAFLEKTGLRCQHLYRLRLPLTGAVRQLLFLGR